jgi:hypothetical protein
MSPPSPQASKRPPLLARLRVGTKLMLLVLLPVGVLVGFMTITAISDWDAASDLRAFHAETQQAFALANVAGQLANERTAAVLLRLQPTPAHRAARARGTAGRRPVARPGERGAGYVPPHRRRWPAR